MISETASQANILFKKDSGNAEKFDGCWWNKLDINLINVFKNKFLINNNPTSYVDLNDFFENYLLMQFKIKKVRISEDFSFTQICKIISKGLKLEHYDSLIRSLCLEKESFFVNKNICIRDIRIKIDRFLKKNQDIMW